MDKVDIESTTIVKEDNRVFEWRVSHSQGFNKVLNGLRTLKGTSKLLGILIKDYNQIGDVVTCLVYKSFHISIEDTPRLTRLLRIRLNITILHWQMTSSTGPTRWPTTGMVWIFGNTATLVTFET